MKLITLLAIVVLVTSCGQTRESYFVPREIERIERMRLHQEFRDHMKDVMSGEVTLGAHFIFLYEYEMRMTLIDSGLGDPKYREYRREWNQTKSDKR